MMDLRTDLPAQLQPKGEWRVGVWSVPRCTPHFTPAPITTGVHTFGGKDLVLVDGRAQFAEVAILRLFEEAGWEGRWVETYGRRKLSPGLWRAWQPEGPHAQVEVPITEAWVNERLHAIAGKNGDSFAGCWDVVAWKDARLVFAEAKKAKHDRIRETQVRWLEAALQCGMSTADFLVVEWTW